MHTINDISGSYDASGLATKVRSDIHCGSLTFRVLSGKKMLERRPNFDGDPVLSTERVYVRTIYVTLTHRYSYTSVAHACTRTFFFLWYVFVSN